ncbi:hypothetical protein PoB_002601500 [Plakobranchus ocellatus]|uniref:Uncharacterized protein n=1 Tax=Plakobranchus ocellatus TaxID=259542 RepID=A0AAV3ZWF6_9GAST|nr:hypothetical protein PoB_002601500 [Plakobranchus ocellatus]
MKANSLPKMNHHRIIIPSNRMSRNKHSFAGETRIAEKYQSRRMIFSSQCSISARMVLVRVLTALCQRGVFVSLEQNASCSAGAHFSPPCYDGTPEIKTLPGTEKLIFQGQMPFDWTVSGKNALFLLSVPTTVRLSFINLFARSRLVNKLLQKIFLQLPLKSSINLRTVLVPIAILFSVTGRV